MYGALAAFDSVFISNSTDSSKAFDGISAGITSSVVSAAGSIATHMMIEISPCVLRGLVHSALSAAEMPRALARTGLPALSTA